MLQVTTLKKRFCWAVIVLGVLVAAAAISLRLLRGDEPSQAAQAEIDIRRIHELVTVGMDIDEAIAKMRDAGITGVGRKHQPTGKYWLVHVTLRTDWTLADDIEYATGTKVSPEKKMFLLIKADEDGTIVSVD